MPRAKKSPTTSKKTVVKPTSGRPTSTRATRARTPEYIDITEHQAELREGSRTTWIIVGVLSIIIVLFWFWTFKQSVAKSTSLSDVSQFTQEIQTNLAQWHDQFNQLDATTSKPVATSSDLEAIKAAIIEQIETGLGPTQWPEHDSQALGISVRYPLTWFKEEQGSTITLRSYESATNTPEVLGQVTITRHENPTKASTENWMRLQPGAQNYAVDTSSSTVAVAGQPVIRYVHRDVDANDIHWLLYIGHDTTIYEIDLFARNGKNIYDRILENIIASIKLKS